MKRAKDFNTKAIHAGGPHKNPENAVNSPIFMTSTFEFNDLQHVDDVMSFKSDDYVYTRGNNPTLRMLENRIAALEEGDSAVAFASGMAAISSVIFSLMGPEDEIIVHRTLYGSSYSVVTKLLPKYNMNYKIEDLTDPSNLEKIISDKTKVIYFETPSNPNLEVIDIKAIAEIAHRYNAKVVVDNTFATPYLQRPLTLGADVVVHSATKYLSGHGDIVGGLAISKDPNYILSLKFEYMCEFGGVMSPFNAWLLLRGIKTLGIRMEAHEKSAKQIAEYLEKHPKVEKVFYPGLETFKGHEIAKEQMDGYGAMISFEVKGGYEAASKVIEGFEMAKLAVSLGDCETLVEMPAAITHRGYDKEKLVSFGLTESMIRISVGLESVDDIIEDIEKALVKA